MPKDSAAGQHHKPDQDLARKVKGPVVSGRDDATPAERDAPEYYAKDDKPKPAGAAAKRRG